jgi:hypothetical protein
VEPSHALEASFEHGEAEKGLPDIPDAPPNKKPTE